MNYFNYFSEIEETFIRRRGRNLLLSPIDWALIETWQQRKVPLHIILSGIERIFDTIDRQPAAAQKRNVKSLVYCREEIEARYAEWLERQIGKNGGEAAAADKDTEEQTEEKSLFPPETIAKHLRTVFVSLEKARKNAAGDLDKTLATAAAALARLEKDFQTTEHLEQLLENLDAKIDESLLRDEAANDELKLEIRKQLAGYKNKMAADVYQKTFDLMLLKRRRDNSDIPRISLFYL